MRSKNARAVVPDDSEDDDNYSQPKKNQKRAASDAEDGDDDDLPSFAAIASTSKSGPRTSMRKASATSSTSSAAPAPAPKPAPARRARPRPTAAKAAATASQTTTKKVLTAAEQEELRKIREQEREEDDFFTSKREFTFKTGGKQTALPLPKGRTLPSSSSKQPTRSKPTQKVVINLDQDDSSSSSDNGSHSGSGSDSSETRAKRKRRKKSKTPVKLASPTKRAASSSSSSSSDSDSDSSAQRRKKRLKGEKKEVAKTTGANGARDRKGKGRASVAIKDEPRNYERSLSPLAQADTFEVAHALQDIRRHRPNMGRRHHVSSEGEDLGQEAIDELGELVGGDGLAGQGASRSRSASHHRGDSTDPLGHGRASMTPFADDHELTEEEKEAKYGPMTSISVKMVHDPRTVITDQNRNGVKRYTAPMDIKVRSRENFENVFGRVSTEKGIERGNIVLTYNGQRLYSFGTPHSLSILSSANFEAYPREIYDYVQQQRTEQKARELAQAREHQLESIARGNMPGAQRNKAIDLDEADEDRANGAAVDGDDGNDSDVQIVPRGGSRLDSLQPAESRRDERSVSLAAADTANAGAASKEPALKVTIRGGPQQQLNLRVPLIKTISTLIKAYLKKFSLDMALSSKCKVFFDGEALSHDLKLEDADIEDEDTLDIRVPST